VKKGVKARDKGEKAKGRIEPRMNAEKGKNINRIYRMGRMDNPEPRDWDIPLAPFGKGEFKAEGGHK
jgi:hypothetical protein